MPPDPYDLKNMQRFMCSEKMNYNTVLHGCDMDIWGTILRENSHSNELVVLRAREGPDSFSRKLSAISVPLIKKFGLAGWKKPHPDYGVIAVSENQIFRITAHITSMVASVLPVVCIMVLVNVEGLSLRLGTIGACNVLLSLCLIYLTEAKRRDIFAVTAMYASLND